MSNRLLQSSFAVILLAVFSDAGKIRADEYTVDAAHSGINFKISHLGLSWVFGRFNDFSGSFVLDADASKNAFSLNIKTDSVDTNNKKRDDHLRGPDFFNSAQFPSIAFKSTAVKAIENGFQVTGDFTMHGVTKSITLNLVGGMIREFPKKVQRTGFTTELVVNRSDYGMDKFKDAIGDQVHITVSFEGTKK
jgi:polyisoprenoid-binding protein YceI